MKIKKLIDSTFKDFELDYSVKAYSASNMGNITAKPYYSHDWIEENGLEVYIPTNRKVAASDIEVKCYIHHETGRSKYDTLINYLLGGGVMVLYDDKRGIKYNVAFEESLITSDSSRGSKTFISFTLKFKNISGVAV